jgi:mercuric ion binding protein
VLQPYYAIFIGIVILMRVAGVSKAKVSYDRRAARVTFEDSKTDVAALTEATKDVGYPAFLSDRQP